MLAPCSFTSDRLVYRALDPQQDEQFVLDTLGDPGTQLGVNRKPVRPLAQRNVAFLPKHVEGCLLAVVFSVKDTSASEKGEARVGWMHLRASDADNPSDRCADFAIVLNKNAQGKGYGREAMEWLLHRAFIGYGLNRVQSACWTWNEPAVRLYKRVGFVVEGTKRQACWQEGAFRDEYIIAILAEDYHKRIAESGK